MQSYVGQGMIAGTKVAVSMLMGSVIGWGILGPYAVSQSWVSRNGDTDDWQQSEAGWVLWVSLSIMLGESITSLVIILLRTLLHLIWSTKSRGEDTSRGTGDETLDGTISGTLMGSDSPHTEMSGLRHDLDQPLLPDSLTLELDDDDDVENENEDDIPTAIWMMGLLASCLFCVFTFSSMTKLEVMWYECFVALLFALLISLLSVRALGETDFNPVSGVGKGMYRLYFMIGCHSLSLYICTLCVIGCSVADLFCVNFKGQCGG